ncbi:serine hydrolase domain-containing protein [Enterococcus rivorum]|uniref:Serine hydrolase n=1 Tax=Enterococcus rivorum TaxID=762845 RepID=A0A1E5KTL3_9ENTE|nr:serine hydrolase [Enterococcus rivorum]MBP2097920.1 CubicO group peptidase (beta-lactamase class C family) [Enterococcus rivorum]OEH81227.1 serine hydrolase [Enterococcus rivorum]
MYEKTKEQIELFLSEGVFPSVSFSFINKDDSEDFYLGNAQVVPTKEKLTSAMLFDVASLTKVVCTTTVVLQLVGEQRIELDAPLSQYYPKFRDERITIRHLLTHTADIQTYIENRDLLNKQELQQAYNGLKSGQEIGKKVVYTDAGTILLGFMLEELLNKSVIEIFYERVLLPLGMDNSRFLPTNLTLTVPTENHNQRGLIRGETHDPKAFILAEHAGNAGLFTNINDLKKFVQMYLNFGNVDGRAFLKSETIYSLLLDQTPTKELKRSLGWDFKYELKTKKPILFHTGYTGTFIFIDLFEQEAFIFLSNRVHPIDNRESYIQKRDQLLEIYLKEKACWKMNE